MHTSDNSFLSTASTTTLTSDPQNSDDMSGFDTFCSNINTRIRKQVQKMLAEDALLPCDISQFDVDTTLAGIDPVLWKMVTSMTKTVTESRNNTNPDNLSPHRKLHCLYCLCVMFFASNRCCSMPIHVLLTDLIDSQGGSAELVRMLNGFGAVASVDTHRRYVQFQVKKASLGCLSTLNLDTFTAFTLDNIDYRNRHSFVDGTNRSWHGTTIQVVQPSLDSKPASVTLHQERPQSTTSLNTAVLAQCNGSAVGVEGMEFGVEGSLSAELGEEGSLSAELVVEGSLSAELVVEGVERVKGSFSAGPLSAELGVEGVEGSLSAGPLSVEEGSPSTGPLFSELGVMEDSLSLPPMEASFPMEMEVEGSLPMQVGVEGSQPAELGVSWGGSAAELRFQSARHESFTGFEEIQPISCEKGCGEPCSASEALLVLRLCDVEFLQGVIHFQRTIVIMANLCQ